MNEVVKDSHKPSTKPVGMFSSPADGKRSAMQSKFVGQRGSPGNLEQIGPQVCQFPIISSNGVELSQQSSPKLGYPGELFWAFVI